MTNRSCEASAAEMNRYLKRVTFVLRALPFRVRVKVAILLSGCSPSEAQVAPWADAGSRIVDEVIRLFANQLSPVRHVLLFSEYDLLERRCGVPG